MMRITTEGQARQAGYDLTVLAEGGDYCLELLIRRDIDRDSTVIGWSLDEGRMIGINGWLFTIEEC